MNAKGLEQIAEMVVFTLPDNGGTDILKLGERLHRSIESMQVALFYPTIAITK